MPRSKKHKPSGFMEFTIEWKKQHGNPHMNIKQCIATTSSLWQKLSAQERQLYNDRAKVSSGQDFVAKREVQISFAQPVELTSNPEDEERQMRRHIETTVRSSVNNAELEMKDFYFLKVNYFTKTKTGEIYIPAELALSAFSLHDGVYRVYHTLINPCYTTFGHQYQAVQHANNTHQLPLPPKALGESDMSKVYQDIIDFVRDNDTGGYSPIYTYADEIPIVQSAVEYIRTANIKPNDSAEDIKKLKIYSIQYLFHILKQATCKIGGLAVPPSVHVTTPIFERDRFEYQIGISCNFHEKADLSKYCAQSCVIRWGFMFADYMCSDLAIKLRSGRHYPDNSNFKFDFINPTNNGTNENGKMERFETDCTPQEQSDDSKSTNPGRFFEQEQPSSSHSMQRHSSNENNYVSKNETNTNPWHNLEQRHSSSRDMTMDRWRFNENINARLRSPSSSPSSQPPTPPPAPVGLDFGFAEIFTNEEESVIPEDDLRHKLFTTDKRKQYSIFQNDDHNRNYNETIHSPVRAGSSGERKSRKYSPTSTRRSNSPRHERNPYARNEYSPNYDQRSPVRNNNRRKYTRWNSPKNKRRHYTPERSLRRDSPAFRQSPKRYDSPERYRSRFTPDFSSRRRSPKYSKYTPERQRQRHSSPLCDVRLRTSSERSSDDSRYMVHDDFVNQVKTTYEPGWGQAHLNYNSNY